VTVRIQAAFLCDAANVRDGMLSVLSVGVTRLYRPTLPAPFGVALAALLEVPQDGAGIPHQIQAIISDAAGGQVAQAMGAVQIGQSPRIEPGENYIVPVVIPLQAVAVPAYGRYTVTFSVDGEATETLPVYMLHPDEQKLPRPF
jgi:hypothetical protein